MAISVTRYTEPFELNWRELGDQTRFYPTNLFMHKMTMWGRSDAFSYNVRIADDVTNCILGFKDYDISNCEIVFGNNVKDCTGMFSGAYLHNVTMRLPDTFVTGMGMFSCVFNHGCKVIFNSPNFFNFDGYKATNTNSAISINTDPNFKNLGFNAIFNWSYTPPDKPIFSSAPSNSTFIFENGCGAVNFANQFNNSYGLQNFSCIMHDGVTNCAGMFYNTHLTNGAIRIGNNTTNCYQMFYNCRLFNTPINIPSSVVSCDFMFVSCTNLNSPVNISNGVKNCCEMFESCTNFNQPMNVPDSVINCHRMLFQCGNLNSPVRIGNNVIDCSYMFYYCSNFNQPIKIGNNATNCSYMFQMCKMFNQPLIISNYVTDCYQMMPGCDNFRSPVIIGTGASNCQSMFSGMSNFDSNVYFMNENATSTTVINMFRGGNNSLAKNIYCNNLDVFRSGTGASSIVGAAITWIPMSNGFYNATYNIFLFNNMPSNVYNLPEFRSA